MVERTDVLIIGSGFGGSVAALRFASHGHKVIVLERGDRVTRDRFEADLDIFWRPEIGSFGFHDLRGRGKTIVPWLGAAVGGGSHVYAATLKRRDSFADFPAAIARDDLGRHFEVAERMLGVTPYPDYPPYDEVPALQRLLRAGAELERRHPDLVEGHGRIPLGMAFAPRDGGEGQRPGDPFVNEHGAAQRYSDPSEQSLLGGDIDAKNTLDKNYLYLAERRHGADIRPLCEATSLEKLPDGTYRVHYRGYRPERGWAQFRRRWLFRHRNPNFEEKTIEAKILVVACGAIGSTELLLRSRDQLGGLSPALGTAYTTNGDCLTGIIPSRGVLLAWLTFIAAVALLALGAKWLAGLALLGYYASLHLAGRAADPDIGATNSDYVRFKGRAGEPQGVYIESGRWPTLGKLAIAILLSSLGSYRPTRYRWITRATAFLRAVIPPFGAIARSWPIPLLTMGKDVAKGTIKLVGDKAVIDFPIAENKAYYDYTNHLGRLVAKAADSWWMPNLPYLITRHMEVPHNQGGVPMGEDATTGVVNHAGRVFGQVNLMVLDGSIVPVSPQPNPALTILALSERAMEIVVAQLDREGRISAEERAAADQVA